MTVRAYHHGLAMVSMGQGHMADLESLLIIVHRLSLHLPNLSLRLSHNRQPFSHLPKVLHNQCLHLSS